MENLPRRGLGVIARTMAVSLGLVGCALATGCSTQPPQIYLLDRGYIASHLAEREYLGQTQDREPQPLPQIAIDF